MELTARALMVEDISLIMDYWFGASSEYLHGMGADINKFPSRNDFAAMIKKQTVLPYEQKKGFATIWEVDGKPCGHCNINIIKYGEEAKMHLHLWQTKNRQKGMGSALATKSLPFFFKHFDLKKLLCEPYALNPAPNKTLPKIGFSFVKNYHTTPGSINFPQEVNQYVMTRETFLTL